MISEIYVSRQGEGILTGTPSWFVRTSGCNLRCWFCDTPFTSWEPQGKTLGLQEIVSALDRSQARHVVLTGGEPLVQKSVEPLTQLLQQGGFHITVETAGTVYRPVHCDLVSISPKLSNSTPTPGRSDRTAAGKWAPRHAATRHQPDVIRRLLAHYDYQLKFVVDQPQDLSEIESYLAEFPEIDRARVMLMPQGVDLDDLTSRKVWLEPYCQKQGFTYCPRMHIQWYGNRRGT